MIVEFIEERDFMTAWVLSPASRRISVLGMGGREMTVSRNRILNSQDFPDPGNKPGRLELIRAADASRRNMAAEVQLDELWEVLEGEGPLFPFEALASLYFGDTGGIDAISAVTRAVFSDGLKFRFSPDGAVRNSQEEVERLVANRENAAAAEQAVDNIARWLVQGLGREPEPGPMDDGSAGLELLSSLAVWGDKAPDKDKAKKVLEKAGVPHDEKGAFEALVAMGHFDRHENLQLLRMGIPLTFNEESQASLSSISTSALPRVPDRLNLTDLKTMTIDSNGARDMDDAVSITSLAGGRWRVGIHITDVAAFIGPDTPLDLEARARASSIYFPDGKYPMLPGELSEGLLSLTPGDVKPAFSFLATVEKDGSVSEYSLAPSLIRVDRQLSFAEADQLLDDDSDLVDLWDLAQCLIARRETLGGMNLNIPKLNTYILPDGSLSVGLTQWNTPAKTIIGELMILANYLAADYLNKNNCPCPYRYQEKPRPFVEGRFSPLVTAGEGVDDDAVLAGSLAARRRTGRSGISFTSSVHSGLGLPVYTSFTAPMRRYLDLLVARQLHSLVAGGPPAMDQQLFLRLAMPTYEMAQSIQKMQNFRQRYWLKVHLADKIGRDFSALVFEQNERRLRICITDYMLETDMFLPRGDSGAKIQSYLGRRLKVRLAAVPPAVEEGVRFELVHS